MLFESIAETVRVPFEPITLVRPAGPYARLLGLEVGQPQAPAAEFLVRLLSGYDSHQAYLRSKFGSQYKNLENHLRGRHRPTDTSLKLLADITGESVDFLLKCHGASPEGPLVPGALVAFELFESLPSKLSNSLWEVEVACPCCGANVVHDAKAWWRKHGPLLGEAEVRFVERMLNAIFGGELVCRLRSEVMKDSGEAGLQGWDTFAAPERHPMGHWIAEGQRLLRCNTLAEVAARMNLQGGEGQHFSHARLKKWSSGQDLMPVKMTTAFTEACARPSWNWIRLAAARAFAVLTEFVMAACPAPLSRAEAQQVVHSRYLAIAHKFVLVSTKVHRNLEERLKLVEKKDESAGS